MGYQKRSTLDIHTPYTPLPPAPDPRLSSIMSGSLGHVVRRLCWCEILIWSKQKRMLEESERMIADNNKRLGAAVHELRELIVGLRSIFLVITPPILTPFDRSRLLIMLSRTDPVKG